MRNGLFRAFVVLALACSPVLAGGASFGDTVTADVKLTCDLSGSGDGLIVGADHITIDLNGYTIDGDGTGVGIDVTGYEKVKIKNGAIVDFGECVYAEDADKLKLENLTLQTVSNSLEWAAVEVRGAKGLTIKDCDISVPGDPPHGVNNPKAACVAVWGVTKMKIEKCTMDGGFFGVACSETFSQPDADPTNGKIKDCDITDCLIGILAAYTTDMKIEKCEVSGCQTGIRLGLSVKGVSNVKVKDCEIHDNFDGLAVQTLSSDFSLPFVDNEKIKLEKNEVYDNTRMGMLVGEIQNSKIKGNDIHDNGFDGLRLLNDSQNNKIEKNVVTDNGGDGIGLRSPRLHIGPSNNDIKKNTSEGNGGFDCFHDEYSTPNDWDKNDCDTSSGADIDS